MSNKFSVEGADRITVGTSDVTMRIWHLVNDSGDEGLSRDEIADLVAPHINAGYARRRYLTHLEKEHRLAVGRGSATARPDWESTDTPAARSFVLSVTLKNMRKNGSLIRGDDNRYRAARKPRYQRDERALDLAGDITRMHMNGVEALRVLGPALERHRQSHRAQLTLEEWNALARLVELFREQMAAGFPALP